MSPRTKLRKYLSPAKIEQAMDLYNRLIEWDAKKYDIAQGRTNGLPWCSLTQMCALLGWKNEIRQRYQIMELKKALRKACLISFKKLFEVGKKLADTFMFLCTKPRPIVFAGERTSPRSQPVGVNVVPGSRVSLVDEFRSWMAS